jgi:hypothetical protein
MAQRWFAPEVIAAELAAPVVPTPVAAAVAAGAAGPRPAEAITEPLSRTPRTFLPGDWKLGNLGSHPDGRTILLDWTLPGVGPACRELCWCLALNRARLPEHPRRL